MHGGSSRNANPTPPAGRGGIEPPRPAPKAQTVLSSLKSATGAQKCAPWARWIRVPVRDPLWLLPSGPDQVRSMSSPEPIERARRFAHTTRSRATWQPEPAPLRKSYVCRTAGASPVSRRYRPRLNARATASPAHTRFWCVSSRPIAWSSAMGRRAMGSTKSIPFA